MIVDTSAIIAILKEEDDADVLSLAILDAPSAIEMSAASYLEAGIVIDKNRIPQFSIKLDALINDFGIEIAPVTSEQAKIARQAYRDFGKGSGHQAQLNFGDCFTYALAVDRNDGLLYKGNDFSHTGIRRS